ncbi:MAG: hypothetical protein V7690_01475 [Shewanella sp.]|uniref:hypothetical protein n=1 Tax=Shewanella sp. TaxID=50422 RepID=UPI00300391E6
MNNKCSAEFTELVTTSALYQNFICAISDPKVTHVSFDVFDTVLRRRCHDPKHVFTEVILQLPAHIAVDFPMEADEYLQIRISAEKLAKQASCHEEICFDDIFKQMALPEDIVNILKQQEIEIEKAQCFADPICALLLDAVNQLGKQVVFISDMYLPNESIKGFIDDACVLNDYRLFVSNEFGQTKYTGQLFTTVLSELGIKASEIVHIGDHLTSDVHSPKIMGINCLLFNTNSDFSEVLLREKHYQVELPAKIKLARTLASIQMPQYIESDDQLFYQMGATIFGPVLTQMSQWVVADCLRLKIDSLMAIMREGQVFSACINRHLKWKSINSFSCVNFYASRKATYLPSLININIDDALSNTLARKYFTLGDLITEFGITAPELEPLTAVPVSSLNNIDVAGENGLLLVKKIFEQKSEQVAEHIKFKHGLFIDYLTQTINTNSQDCFASLDLGPGATIAQQISRATEQKAKVNYLLYASERGYSKVNEIVIKSFFPLLPQTQKSIEILARSPEVLEYFLVGETGTTLGYQREHGKVTPECENRSLTDVERQNYQAFDQGVKAFQTIANQLNIEAPSQNERISYTQMLCRLVDCPTSNEAQVIGQCQHEENFGSQGKFNIIKPENVMKVQEESIERFYQTFCERASSLQRQIPWPQGVITHLSPNYLSVMARINSQENVHFGAVQALLETLTSGKISNVIVYGAGDFFLYLHDFLVENKIKIHGLIDRRALFSNFRVNNIQVKSLPEYNFSGCSTIVIASSVFIDEIKQDLAKVISLENYKVITM